MWLMLNDAFLSIVSKDCARDELLVRARRQGDIEKIFPKAKVTRNTRSDYLFRAVIKRSVVEAAMVGELRRVTYSNFKDSVTEDLLHNAYLRVWVEMSKLQPTRPYAGLAASYHKPDFDSPYLFSAAKNAGRVKGGLARAAKHDAAAAVGGRAQRRERPVGQALGAGR
jgi:hypothetical protein